MPFHYMHTIYKEYIVMMLDETKRQGVAGEQLVDEMIDG